MTASARLIASLLSDVREGLEVFRSRDGVELTDAQIAERTRNIVDGLSKNYAIFALPSEDPEPAHLYGCRRGACSPAVAPELRLELRTERPAGAVPWHGWSCQCGPCADAKQRDRS